MSAMSRGSMTGRGNASSGPEEAFRESGKSLPTNSIVMRVARGLWPRKTDLELAARTTASDRMARYWLAERYRLSADDLAALLRSDAGLDILEAIMGDAVPAWWRRVKRAASLSALRRAQEEQRQKIEQLELNLD